MSQYRTEVRIFGLLIFALISSLALGIGIHKAEASGDILGIKFFIAGPSAAFIIMLLIFHYFGLFKLGLEHVHGDDLTRPVEKMELDDIENSLDAILIRERQIARRKVLLEGAKNALNAGATEQEVLVASGIKPARRGSA